MKLSGSYFRKMDDLAKWIFGRSRDSGEGSPKKNPREPQTLNEAKVRNYAPFQNDTTDNTAELSNVSILRQVKSARNHSTSNPSGTERYMRRVSREKSQTCTICLDAGADAVLMDCGHGAICFVCGLALLNTTCECHLCRQPVVQVLKIDTSFVSHDLLKVVEAADLHSIAKYNRKRLPLYTANQ